MANNQDSDISPPSKRPRGRYRQYLLDIDSPTIIPKSTQRNRVPGGNSPEHSGCITGLGDSDLHNISDDGHCLQGDSSSASSSSSVNLEQDFEVAMEDGEFTSEDELTQEDGEMLRNFFLNDLTASNPTSRDESTSSQDRPEENTRKEKVEAFIERHGLKDFLLPGVIETTKLESVLMILHIVMRHGNTGALVTDLIKFVNTLLRQNVLNPSLYIFKKLFSSSVNQQVHFLCPQCHLYLGEKTSFKNLNSVTCPDEKCKAECNVHKEFGENVFISLPIAKQIQDLLLRPDTVLINRPVSNDGVIRDYMDGLLYKKLLSRSRSRTFLTVTFNTDGVSMFKSSHKSLYPIFVLLNEIIPEHRLKHENVILAGIWFGKSSPDMTSFFRPFVDELKFLAEHGVWGRDAEGRNVLLPVYPLICSVDLIAKPKIQKIRQFNGRLGCGYCLHPNVDDRTRQRGYHANKDYPLRTNASLRSDMMQAHALDSAGRLRKTVMSDDSVNGALGLSPLLALPEFDIVNGFAIDYMHNALEGVMQLLVRIWFDGTYKDRDFYLASHLTEIDQRMAALKTPSTMTRKPRPLSERAFWKAREWRAFLLFFALPILKDFLPLRYFKHFASYVEAVFILLGDSISEEHVLKADGLLKEFLKAFQVLYKEEHMVYNLHLCSHLATSVSHCGPLWCSSNFVFESANGQLLKYLQGTKGVAPEIARKYLIMQSVSEFFKDQSLSKHAIDFCTDVCSYTNVKKFHRCSDDVVLLGAPSVENVTAEESDCFKNIVTDFPSGQIVFYNRAIRGQIVFCSDSYSRAKVHNDCCVQLCDQSYAVIQKIIKVPSSQNTYVIVKPIRLSTQSEDHLLPHIKSCAYDLFGSVRLLPFSNILKKSIFISVKISDTFSRFYVCDFPNFYEKD